MKKKKTKESAETKFIEDENIRAKKRELEKDIEIAFLNEEESAVQREKADQIMTKRIIDKMMSSKPENLEKEICELLSNYKGLYKILFC